MIDAFFDLAAFHCDLRGTRIAGRDSMARRFMRRSSVLLLLALDAAFLARSYGP